MLPLNEKQQLGIVSVIVTTGKNIFRYISFFHSRENRTHTRTHSSSKYNLTILFTYVESKKKYKPPPNLYSKKYAHYDVY